MRLLLVAVACTILCFFQPDIAKADWCYLDCFEDLIDELSDCDDDYYNQLYENDNDREEYIRENCTYPDESEEQNACLSRATLRERYADKEASDVKGYCEMGAYNNQFDCQDDCDDCTCMDDNPDEDSGCYRECYY